MNKTLASQVDLTRNTEPTKLSWMMRPVGIVACLMLAGFLAACGGADDSECDPSAMPSESANPEPDPSASVSPGLAAMAIRGNCGCAPGDLMCAMKCSAKG